jgi:hypothetical protein
MGGGFRWKCGPTFRMLALYPTEGLNIRPFSCNDSGTRLLRYFGLVLAADENPGQ